MLNVPANAPTLREMLTLGSRGEFVRLLQANLNAEPFCTRLIEDGKLGKATFRELLVFQSTHKLKADGIVGPRTAAALGWRYLAPPPKPHVIRRDKPPLPGTTPPPLVVAETLRTGFARLCYLLKLEIDKNGLSENGRKNAKGNIDIMYGVLTHGIDLFLDRKDLTDFDFVFSQVVVLEFQTMALKMGVEMKDLGGKVRGYADLLEKSEKLVDIGDMVKPLMRGEQSAEETIAKIRMRFQAILGPY